MTPRRIRYRRQRQGQPVVVVDEPMTREQGEQVRRAMSAAVGQQIRLLHPLAP